ncbi:carbohydrate sulfotransferase 4-like [Saccostrea echinata]|uniref:carbohydrate sulfotransferase 4-like n=1 Tax=Saccostrea echinata TaxID=191078 RepID=UPI002A81070F|nr:carbohydrate sulfotransferase 4-like [Saccostrea echinata]
MESTRRSLRIAVLTVGPILLLVDVFMLHNSKKHRMVDPGLISTEYREQISKKNSLLTTDIHPIIILSTFRSGSSLTGDILQQDKDSFYLYEPLNPLNYLMYQNITTLHLVNGSVQPIGIHDFNKVSANILLSLITCDFTSLDVNTVSHGFLYYSNRSVPYITCVDRNKRRTTLLSAIRKCLPILIEACEQSTHRIFKIVRLSMDWMERLLEKFPKLVVVHLIRDPRPIQVSRDNLGANIFKDLRKSFQELCDLLSWNLFFESKLNNTYNRIVRLYYEDLALYPFRTSKWLYNILGLHYTSDVHAYVHHLTRAGIQNDCSTCAIRANSSAHAYSWRGFFNASQLNTIQDVCGNYMKAVGYINS